jgi:hypothetical protein
MSTQTNDIKTILVIGNGFDKKCGLKSSYNDFLNDKNFWPTDSSKYHSIEKSF